MKKILKAEKQPAELERFVLRHPLGDPSHKWDSARHAKKAVQKQLYHDQRGLCAYCEINLTFASSGNIGDISVEHFHPESDTSRDWAFMWSNMLGVCKGGREIHLAEQERVATGLTDYERKSNQHCDGPKGEDILDEIILNPLKIKTTESLFSIEIRSVIKEGKHVATAIDLVPIHSVCDKEDEKCYQKAQETICRLHLNCDLLGKFRYQAIEKIKLQLNDLMKDKKLTFEDAAKSLMKQYFDNTSINDMEKPNWPPFFTIIRAYYKEFVEPRLKEIKYEG